jgi:hypothetical protein
MKSLFCPCIQLFFRLMRSLSCHCVCAFPQFCSFLIWGGSWDHLALRMCAPINYLSLWDHLAICVSVHPLPFSFHSWGSLWDLLTVHVSPIAWVYETTFLRVLVSFNDVSNHSILCHVVRRFVNKQLASVWKEATVSQFEARSLWLQGTRRQTWETSVGWAVRASPARVKPTQCVCRSYEHQKAKLGNDSVPINWNNTFQLSSFSIRKHED